MTVFGVFRGSVFASYGGLSVFWCGRGLAFLGSIRKQGYYESSIYILCISKSECLYTFMHRLFVG